MNHDLATLAADPERIDSLPSEAIPSLIGATEALKARLWQRLQAAGAATAPSKAPTPPAGPDRLLTATEAAERLGVNTRWVYRKAPDLPFTRKLSGGTLRFSEKGLEKWKETKR